MLKGLSCSISEVLSQDIAEISIKRKKANEKHSTQIYFKDQTNRRIKFVEIGSEYFKIIRNIRGVEKNVILHSLNTKFNIESLLKVKEGKGKSGSFFFYSHDKRLIIKIIQYEEKHSFKRMLSKYCKHLESNPNTLLSIIYSLFSLKVPGMAKVYAIVFQNSRFIGGKYRVKIYIYI